MRWASSISDADDLASAVEACTEQLAAQLASVEVDLVLAFPSSHHRPAWHELPALIRDRFPAATVVGCSGGSVLGDGRELEGQAGLALAAARLPGVELTPFDIPTERTPDPAEAGDDPEAERARWNAAIGLDDGPDPHLLLFPDPLTWTGAECLASLDRAYPSGVKVGGLCSGGRRPGEHGLFCQRSLVHRGMVGLALRGNIELDTVVAQGCRPIGAPMFVTRCEGSVIIELDGRPAADALDKLLRSLPPPERARAQRSLFIGKVMDPTRERYEQGDFLIRNLIGVDPRNGAIGTAARLEPNAVIQFHVRDAETSNADLRVLLTEQAQALRGKTTAGALMFSCLGRGRGLYGEPDHDSKLVREFLGADLPIAGLFANGEIGPVGGRTHLHGYTSSVLLIRGARMV